MAWGGLRQIFKSLPPVIAVRQIVHNFEVAGIAAHQGWDNGDWTQALNTLLELPQENAEAARATGRNG